MSPALSTVLALLALLVAATALVLATVANRRWAQRPRPRAAVGQQAPAGWDAEAALAGLRRQVDLLSGEVAAQRERLEPLDLALAHLGETDAGLQQAVAGLQQAVAGLDAAVADPRDATALRHVAVVRYDAFADVGGRLSYSVAMLDDTRSGLVLTTLAGKSDVRTYVRTISAGTGDGTLTAEEQQAIDAAAAGAPGSQQ